MWQLGQGSLKDLAKAHGNVKKKERTKWAEDAQRMKQAKDAQGIKWLGKPKMLCKLV